jgi:hypothetical protein
MATTITYVLVSGADDVSAVRDHQLVSESVLEHRETRDSGPQQVSAVSFAAEQPLEEEEKLSDVAREMSDEFSEATVILCEVEERFDHVERLQTLVFMNGKNAGKVEHGYIFNVGQQG